MVLKSSLVIFQALKTSAASVISLASVASLASTASAALIPQKTSWSRWYDQPWQQNDQNWSLFMERIIKNPTFYWYMVFFLSEAVEASLCYFFETGWLSSNVQTSGTHRYFHYNVKVVFSWPQRSSKCVKVSWNTLYASLGNHRFVTTVKSQALPWVTNLEINLFKFVPSLLRTPQRLQNSDFKVRF